MAGYTITLYANRLEIVRGVLGMKQTETILLRNVSDVQSGIGKRLTVMTNDGKRHMLNVAGKPADELRQKMMDAL
jgi:hypothetical protein